MNTRTKKIITAAMFSSLCCVATILIKIPSPLKGYINLGDCVVLLAGFMLSPIYGFSAAGIGSALADIFAGYILYAPATFIIKGIMALTVYYTLRFMQNKFRHTVATVIGCVIAEAVMITGYFLFDGFFIRIYGFSHQHSRKHNTGRYRFCFGNYSYKNI